MGKKKSRKIKVMKAAPLKVEKVFDCPYCQHKGTIEIKIQRTKGVAHLSCRICTINYQTEINKLTKEVDVYCQWIDLCEEASKPSSKS
mmetsp:Transcript_1615/g.1097  ORF Transcript_1615/g.1097 Transcript_1615/m.1097 type:complete len:88 (+) Transcript_1615:3-266(+)